MEGKVDSKKYLFMAAAFFVPLVMYIYTLAPTVSFIDTGELATACIKLAVAHPTGYPLFTIIGNLFSHIPIGEPIYRLNLMCAILSAFTILVFYNLLVFLFKDFSLPGNTPAQKQVKSKNKAQSKSVKANTRIKLDDMSIYFICLSASWLLAFSLTFWQTATSIEVYSLHTLFLVSVIFLFLKACNSLKEKEGTFLQREKYWLAFAFVLGLSFSNHLTTIFLGVGTLYLYFALNGFNSGSFKRIAIMAIPFALGLSVYSYLLIRADNPVISWGNTNNLENLFNHVRGKQFSVWMFSSFDNAGHQFNHFLEILPKEFFFVSLIVAIPGLIALYNWNKKLFMYTVLLFSFTVIYAINYDIYDIDSYFLLAFIILSMWIAYGFYFIVGKFKGNFIQYSAATLILVGITLYINFADANQNENYFVQDYTMNVFNSAPENSIIMSSQWDFFISPSIYYQYVKNIRPDLIIIDKELMRKSWYMGYIKKHYPDVYEPCKPQFEAYTVELLKFEANATRYTNPQTMQDQQDLALIRTQFANLLNCIVESNIDKRPIFISYELEQEKSERIGPDYYRIPQGVLLRISKKQTIPDLVQPDLQYTVTDRDSYHYTFIMNQYYTSLVSSANYYLMNNNFTEAEKLLNKAIRDFPNRPEARQLMNKLTQLKQQLNN